MDTERIEKVILVGQSMGGYIAQAFLKKYPDRVQGFIGIDTTPFGLAYYSKSDQWWLKQIEWMCRCYPKKILKYSIAKTSTYTKKAYENMYTALQVYSKQELCHLMGIGYAGFLKENCDLKITCPVLILVGEYDRTGKVKQYCQAWHEKTGYSLHVIKNAAHNANVDNSEEVNGEIEKFIQSIV